MHHHARTVVSCPKSRRDALAEMVQHDASLAMQADDVYRLMESNSLQENCHLFYVRLVTICIAAC